MMKWRDSVLDCGSPLPLFAALALLAASPTLAHDRHATAAIHQDVRVLVLRDHVEVTFILDTNDEARLIEAIAMDANGDGKLSADEQSRYFAQLDARLREGLLLSLNEREVPLRPSDGVQLAPPSRKTFLFKGDLDASHSFPAALMAFNDNFLDWPGKTTLKAEAGAGLVLDLIRPSTTDAWGHVRLASQLPSVPTRESQYGVNWERWSWERRTLTPLIMTAAAVGFGLIASVLMLIGIRSPVGKATVAFLAIAGLVSAGTAFATRDHESAVPQSWLREFDGFHQEFMRRLASYHLDGRIASLSDSFAWHGSPEAIAKLMSATRVADPGDVRSGTFELRRVRPLDTAILEEPQHPLSPILRVRHTWRVIGVMRHDGHPHERVRDFTCEYTLRVTDDGLNLLDCSDWRQLPDEPIE